MARLIAALVRHGDYQQLAETPSAHQPFPLTAQGILQATQLAERLEQFCVQQNCQLNSLIASSRLLRAWQTASVLVENLADTCTIQEYAELAERCVGSAANLTVQQITDIIHLDPRFDDLPGNWKSDSTFCLPFQGAESLLDAGQRMADFLTAQMQLLNRLETDQLKIFVAHGAAFRHAAYHLGVLEFNQIAQLSMYHCQPVFVEYSTTGTWKQVGGQWKIRQKHSQYSD